MITTDYIVLRLSRRAQSIVVLQQQSQRWISSVACHLSAGSWPASLSASSTCMRTCSSHTWRSIPWVGCFSLFFSNTLMCCVWTSSDDGVCTLVQHWFINMLSDYEIREETSKGNWGWKHQCVIKTSSWIQEAEVDSATFLTLQEETLNNSCTRCLMKAACVYNGVIGQQYMPPGSCSCGCSVAAETGSPCFDVTGSPRLIHTPFPPPAGTAGRLWSPVPEHGPIMTYLKRYRVNLSWRVFGNLVGV